jgi:hypothetical protein
MPKLRERGVCSELNRHGTRVWYYRDGHGPRTRLPGLFGSPEFKAAVRAAKGYVTPGAVAPTPIYRNTDTLGWLIDQFMSTPKWAEDAADTKKHRRNILNRLLEKNGAAPFRAIDREWVEDIQSLAAYGPKDAPKAKPTKSQANAVVKLLRVLFGWACDQGLLQVNFARDVKLLGVDNKKGFHAWTAQDRARYEATHVLGTAGRVFYEVLRGTGARIEDAVLLGNDNLRDGVITFTPQKTARKTGAVVEIEMEPELARALAAGPVGKTTWICGEKGQPIGKAYAGAWFRKLCDEAGLPQCSAHGVRKGEAVADAHTGGTVDELKAKYGWSENRTPGIYTAQAERKALSRNLTAKRAAARKPKLALVA